MSGREKCDFLREVRRKIAAENGIPYRTKDCTHSGPCSGTCPYCENEVRYLEDQLKKKRNTGRAVRLVSICAGMAAAVSGCSVIDAVSARIAPSPTPEMIELSGEVPYPYETFPTEDPQTVSQEKTPIPVPTGTVGPVQIVVDELSGYVPYE